MAAEAGVTVEAPDPAATAGAVAAAAETGLLASASDAADAAAASDEALSTTGPRSSTHVTWHLRPRADSRSAAQKGELRVLRELDSAAAS